MTDDEITELRQRHLPNHENPTLGPQWCESCGQPWGEDGCDAARLLGMLDGGDE